MVRWNRAGAQVASVSGLDVIFLAHNRLSFTETSFPMLLANTDWDLVRGLHVFDDASEDGTREFLYEAIHGCPVEYHLHETDLRSPVLTMNQYVGGSDSERFAKIDSDIIVPPGWLPALKGVMDFNRHIDALGMEAGRSGLEDDVEVYGYDAASHIGGVGLIRTATLGRIPKMRANGYFGWTEQQTQYHLGAAWIKPDLRVFSLDQLPFQPWQDLAAEYIEKGWARPWGEYHRRHMHEYWSWAFPDWESANYNGGTA